MGKFDKFCQSCGMPMEKDPNSPISPSLRDGKTERFLSIIAGNKNYFKFIKY